MSSLAQEAVEKICQLFQDCSSTFQLEVCLHNALAYLCVVLLRNKVSLLFAVWSVVIIVAVTSKINF